LCEGGSISFNGKYWLASVTYAHSPVGWDKDLYDNIAKKDDGQIHPV
jgi:hypothetical protein